MSAFNFKNFTVQQEKSAMKVGTDAMLMGALIEAESPTRILDVGTGTGVIALMLAQRYSEAKITGIEIDGLSAEECDSNFRLSPWSERLSVESGDFLSFNSAEQFDLIISNPPYYSSGLHNNDVRLAKARHEFSLPQHKFFECAKKLIRQNGQLYVIVPEELKENWMLSAKNIGFFPGKIINVRGKEGGPYVRSILGWSLRQNEVVVKSEFSVRGSDGKYTKEYIRVTSDFHDRIPS